MRGGLRVPTVCVLDAGGVAGGGVEAGALAVVVSGAGAGFLVFVVRTGFFGFVLTVGTNTGAWATSVAGTSGFYGISSGSVSATVGAGAWRGSEVAFFLLQASVNSKANRRSNVTNLR